MIILENEFSLIDPKNDVVEISYSINKVLLAKIIFNFQNDETEVVGDLYNLIGYKDTTIDKDKFEKYISVQKWMAEKLLRKFKEQ